MKKLIIEGTMVRVASGKALDDIQKQTPGAVIVANRYFRYLQCGSRSAGELFLAPQPLAKRDVTQTVSFKTRQDLAKLFCKRPEPRKLAWLQMALWQQTFPSESRRALRDLCSENTQRLIEALLVEPDYWQDANAAPTPHEEDYSHELHFAPIYSECILAVRHALAQNCGQITVVDIGCGTGCCLQAVASALSPAERSRVRFIAIERARQDLAIGSAAMRKRFPLVNLTCEVANVDVKFGDVIRRLAPDVTFLNHVLEHLLIDPVDVLQDVLHATRVSVVVSVPLNDPLSSTVSNHVREFEVADVVKLGRAMEARCAGAVSCPLIGLTAKRGAIVFERESPSLFGREHRVIVPCGFAPVAVPDLDVFDKPFDVAEFSRAHRAFPVGCLSGRDSFRGLGWPAQCRQLPIKFPGTPVRLPVEFEGCAEAVALMIAHNASINRHYGESFVYLNVFRGPMSFGAYRGLSLNCHTDQMQNLRGELPYRPDYSYIVSSTLPTVLFKDVFDISEPIRMAHAGQAVNLYDTLSAQASHMVPEYTEDYTVYLLSPYVVHSAQVAQNRDGEHRTFVKLAISPVRFFDNRELRFNHAFEYGQWLSEPTVGYIDGFLNHAHRNERLVLADLKAGVE